MAAISIVDYIHELKEAGFTDKQSEVQARKLEQVIIDVKADIKKDIKQEIHIDELATKKDLEVVKLELQKEIEIVRKEIAQASNKTLLLMGTFGVFFLGVLAKGFHWF